MHHILQAGNATPASATPSAPAGAKQQPCGALDPVVDRRRAKRARQRQNKKDKKGKEKEGDVDMADVGAPTGEMEVSLGELLAGESLVVGDLSELGVVGTQLVVPSSASLSAMAASSTGGMASSLATPSPAGASSSPSSGALQKVAAKQLGKGKAGRDAAVEIRLLRETMASAKALGVSGRSATAEACRRRLKELQDISS